MKHIYRISHLVSFLAAFACLMLGFAISAPAAFAVIPATNGGSGGSDIAPAGQGPTFTHTVVAGGMPGWQITLIVAVVAVLAASIAIVVDRTRAVHRIRSERAT